MQSFNSQESIGEFEVCGSDSQRMQPSSPPSFQPLVLTHPGSRRLGLPMRKSRSHPLPLFLFAFIVL